MARIQDIDREILKSAIRANQVYFEKIQKKIEPLRALFNAVPLPKF